LTFLGKVGEENARMMWRFADKGGRDVCLVPEITGLLQETWRTDWSRWSRRRAVFYEARCYRYERPQAGRYREFTQLGVEFLGDADAGPAKALLRECLDGLGIAYRFDDAARRGLSYYVADGFEASVDALGAQKQVAGGGAYAEGVGWAIGVDRVMLALAGGRAG
jgi:histidyl-tRNA synthetase